MVFSQGGTVQVVTAPRGDATVSGVTGIGRCCTDSTRRGWISSSLLEAPGDAFCGPAANTHEVVKPQRATVANTVAANDFLRFSIDPAPSVRDTLAYSLKGKFNSYLSKRK